MNWAQAKNVLIILFIVINSLLLGIIFQTMSVEEQGEELITNTLSILRSRNVEVVCKLPTNTPKMGNMKLKSPSIMYNFNIKKSDSVLDRDNVESKLMDIIVKNYKGKEIPLNQFALNRCIQKENSPEVVYEEKIGECFIFDNSVRAVVYSDRIEGEIKYSELEMAEEKRTVMHINQVLLKNFKSSYKQEKIQYIKCGYIQRNSKTKAVDNVFLPVWEVITEDGRIRYYKAFTGDELFT